MIDASLADKHQFSRQGKITEDFFDIRLSTSSTKSTRSGTAQKCRALIDPALCSAPQRGDTAYKRAALCVAAQPHYRSKRACWDFFDVIDEIDP